MIKLDISENQAKIAYLSIGSNLGNKRINIEKIKNYLQNSDLNIVKISKNYETFSWPDKKKPKFINAVLQIKTTLNAISLLKRCLDIEKKLGRIRGKKNDPRICDIDIIDYNGEKIELKRKSLVLPHPEMHKRNFVLLPLYEINKNWIHPIKKITIKTLINSLNIEDIRTIKLV